ncbi:MAG TPA: 4-hydroxy-tetrahydrodipicolinate reductase [Myxococcota bacterium]|nr:4-hydroxy-tetrahydrodipicolinate reductase [Myxococcota bacterium]
MTRVLVFGALGRMGERVRAAIEAEPEAVLGAAIEAPGHPKLGLELEDGVRLTADVAAGLEAADVAIAFAPPAPTVALVRAAAERGVACAVGTTGLEPAQRAELERLAGKIPMVVTANFSVAVIVLKQLVQLAAERLGPGYDAEIVEAHHARKVDAPSGTALELAERVAAGRGEPGGGKQIHARDGITGAREAGTIGIQSLRGGDNPGEHTVLFLGPGERLELAHRAATRDHFARGALRAALWLRGRAPGSYDMEQVLGLR